jgi:phosphatidylglycerol---prolipoprotein diacylglyceryl transferase
MFPLHFPEINPIAVQIGPLAIRWYALAYVTGLVTSWRVGLALAKRPPKIARPEDFDDFLVWATLGVVLGGRTGYVLFYNFQHYMADPADIIALWHGGMSFHGGLLGVTAAIILFCWQRKINLLAFADIIAVTAPIGLFFGRIANFINGELWGRVSDVPWAMVFPNGGPLPRHPSQLYEAGLEGILLLIILALLARFAHARTRPGMTTGVFLIGYTCARIFVEFFREPDQQVGFLVFGATMGQLLSLPLLLLGLFLLVRALRQPRLA